MFMHLKTSFFYLVAPGEQKSSHIIHEFCNMSRFRIEERTWLFLLICQGSRDFHVSAKNKIHKILTYTYTCTLHVYYIVLIGSLPFTLFNRLNVNTTEWKCTAKSDRTNFGSTACTVVKKRRPWSPRRRTRCAWNSNRTARCTKPDSPPSSSPVRGNLTSGPVVYEYGI